MNHEKLERCAIGDGIYVNFVENDRYKTNYISFFFVTPLNKKTASYNTLLSRVLTRSSEKYRTQRELNQALDLCFDADLTADTAKVGEWHTLAVSLCTLDNAYALEGENITAQGLEILREVLFRPNLQDGAFLPSHVESEKKLALDEICSLVNHKARWAKERMTELMCRKEAYSTLAIGHKGEIKKITPQSLAEYYHELLRTARVEIFFVGRFCREDMRQATQDMFQKIVREPRALPEIAVRTQVKEVLEVTEEMDIAQANLVMGFRTGCSLADSDWRAMSVYNSILGGSLTSKLFCNLREKMSLCYHVSSSPDALKGIMLIYAGIAPENRDVAVKEALRQMDEIRAGNITDEEMENARGALIHAMNGLGDNPSVLAEWYLPRVLIGQIQTPGQIVAQLRRIQKEDVVKVSEKIVLDTVYTLTAKEGQQ